MKHKPHSRFSPTHAYRQAAAAARIVGKADVITAAWNGDIELVKDHVMADTSCIFKADSEYDCLCLCPSHAARFNFLISVISGMTPLMKSSSRGKLDVTRFLVESGANVEAKDNKYYPYNTTFQIARTAVFRFNFSNFCYQG
jgi:hypothetical protein